MADWVPLTPTTDYTLSGNAITLVGITPDDDSAFDVHYSYADASAVGGHQHTVEQRDGAWGEGHWSLAHRPDGQEFLLLRLTSPILVWQLVSDFAATTNQELRLYELTGAASSLSYTLVDGPWSVPSGEIVTFLQSNSAHHTYIGTIRNGGPTRLYRFDRDDGSFNIIFSFAHTPAVTAPRVWQIIIVSELEIYLLLARGGVSTDNGIYQTTDGGQNWTKFADPPFVAGTPQAFAETPSQVYSMVGLGGRIYVLHTGQNDGAGAYWNISYTGDVGGSWSRIVDSIGGFSKGGRGFLYTVNGHLPYLYESFITYGSGDAGTFSQVETDIGDDSQAWMAVFSDGTVLARGTLTPGRISTDYGLTWANTPSTAPAGTGFLQDVMHVTNILVPRNWLLVPDGSVQSIKITTDKGTTWQTLALPNYCGLAAFVGGAG